MCLHVTVGKGKRKKVSNVIKEKKRERVRDNRHRDIDINNAIKRFIECMDIVFNILKQTKKR